MRAEGKSRLPRFSVALLLLWAILVVLPGASIY